MRKQSLSVIAISLLIIGSFIVAFNLSLPSFGASNTLTTTTGTITRPYHQTGFGIDLGQITFAFNTAGVTFADNWVPSTTFNFHIGTWNGITLTPTLSYNSTTIDYHYSGTVSSKTLTADMYLTQKQYNYKIAIIGSYSGTIPLTMIFPTSSVYDSSSNTICIGHLCFYFGDSLSYNPVYVSSTGTLTFTISNIFNIDPIATDGGATCSTGTIPALTCPVTFATSNYPDIVIVFEGAQNNQLITPVETAISGGLTTFQLLHSVVNTWSIKEYYAVSNSVLSGTTVTCAVNTGFPTGQGCIVEAFYNANLNPISDTTYCSTNAGTQCLIKYKINDIVLGMGLAGSVAAGTPTITSNVTSLQKTGVFRSSVSACTISSCGIMQMSCLYLVTVGNCNPTASNNHNTTAFTMAIHDYQLMLSDVVSQQYASTTTTTVTTTTTGTSSTSLTTTTITSYSPTVTLWSPTVTSYSPTVTSTTILTSYSPTVTSTYTSYSPTVTLWSPTVTSYSPTVTSTYTSYSPTVTSYSPTVTSTTIITGTVPVISKVFDPIPTPDYNIALVVMGLILITSFSFVVLMARRMRNRQPT